MMKKIILFLVSVLTQATLSAQISGVIQWTQNQDFSFLENDEYTQIQTNSYEYIEEVGHPQIPYCTKSFVIPTEAEVSGIAVNAITKQQLDGFYHLYPVQHKRVTEPHDFIWTEPDSEIYNSTNPYPGKYAEIISDREDFGYHIITVRFYPIEYIPKEGKLNNCQLAFSLTYSSPLKSRKTSNEAKQSEHINRLNQVYIESIVDNYNQSGAKATLAAQKSANEQSPLSFEYAIPEYLIITNNELKASFQILADWKIKKGIPTIIETVENISVMMQGSDLQEKIRNYLKSIKSKYGSLFVLLGGDANVIPARLKKTRQSDKEGLYAADAYYACVNKGDWNANKNDLFAESNDQVDFGLSFYLGRASVENVNEATIFVQKIINYEKGINNDPTYYNNTLIADAFIGKGACTANKLYDIGKDSLVGNYLKYKEKIASAKSWFIFDDNRCSDPTKYSYIRGSIVCDYKIEDGNRVPIYDPVTGGSCKYGDEELNKSSFYNALNNGGNSGLNYFHLVYHMDHSSPTGMGASSLDKHQYLSIVDADHLSNGMFSQIVMSGGCNAANFTKDCIAEHFLSNPDGGAVAFIGNTDIGWSSEYYQFIRFYIELYKLSGNSNNRYDLSFLHQKANGSYNFNNCALHLLGDPEMPIWTATPQNLNVSVTTSPGDTNNSITVQINNLPTGQDALVCLMKGTEYYVTCTIEDTLPHQFNVPRKSSGNMDVTITAHNFRPFETTVPIDAGSQPLITMETSIKDSGRWTDGNGDGILDAGETVLLPVKLYSAVERTLTNAKFKLKCSAPEITLLDSIVNANTITLTPAAPKTITFRLTVDSLCTEKLKNELTPIRLELSMESDDNAMKYQDACNVEVFASDITVGNQKIVSTFNGNETIEANETVNFIVDLNNIGKAEAVGLTGKISTNSPYIIEYNTTAVEFPDILKYETKSNAVAFQFKTTANYISGQPLPLTLTLRNRYGKTWELALDPANRPTVLPQSSLSFKGYEKAIDLTWSANASLNYNVYRSDTETGEYTKMNAFPLTISYFKDEKLNPYSTYYYKVAAINASGNEGAPSNPIKAWTICPSLSMFPIVASQEQGLFYSRSSVATYDIDNDGKQELFSTQVTWEPTTKSRIIALDTNGTELFEADGNVTTYNGFGTVNEEYRVTPTVTDLKANGESQLIVATRESPLHIRCYSMNERDNNDSPVLLWEKPAPAKYLHNVVAANVDNSSDGSKEIVLASCESSGGVLILDYNGNELWNIDTTIDAYSASAVADLDGDGDMEIIIGKKNGIYIYHHNGTPFSTNPVFTETGYCFGSSPVVCDIDNDGQKEILIVGKKEAESGIPTESIVFAINPDGTLAQGWNKTQKSSFVGSSFCQDLAVGDLNNDGRLEVVVRGRNDIKVWNNQGILLLNKQTSALYNGRMNPILADIDGDRESEIIFGTEIQDIPVIYAINLDGTDVAGFPLSLDFWLRNSVRVSDIDNDGKNELIAIADNAVYAWKTEGKADCIEWGTDRGNNENTGEYGKTCQPTLILSNTVWDGESPCGNLMIQSGNFTLPSGTTMNLNGTSKIIVRSGGTLTVDGATINNASVWAQDGSNIIIRNGGTVNLRSSGNFIIDKGATLDYQHGGIMPY